MFAFGKKRDRNFWEKDNLPKTLSSKLDKRVKIIGEVQTEAPDGSLREVPTVLKTIWAGAKPLKHSTYMRYSNTDDGAPTHEIIIRKSSVDDLNTQFTTAFNTDFNSKADINPIKSNMFLMLLSSDTTGRYFRIRRVMNADEKNEYLSLLCEEIEEQGTGMPGIAEGIL